MTIDDDHLYHGAALIQIAEDRHFTAINSIVVKKEISRSAYRINDKIGVYLKYASKPHGTFKEYIFTFIEENIKELQNIKNFTPKLFIALICVKSKQICVLTDNEFFELIERRKNEKGSQENQYSILVTLKKGESFRAYINFPGEKKKYIGKPIIISRNDFPRKIFI